MIEKLIEIDEEKCDGPQGAITFIEREAAEYDPVATVEHLKEIGRNPSTAHGATPGENEHPLPCGCPGSASRSLVKDEGEVTAPSDTGMIVDQSCGTGRSWWPVRNSMISRLTRRNWSRFSVPPTREA